MLKQAILRYNTAMMNRTDDLETLIRTFQSHYDLLVTVAVRYAPAPDLVYDIVQQAFVDFVEGMRKNPKDLSEIKIVPFLYEITKNRAIKHWAEQRKKRPEVLQRVGQRLAAQIREDEEQQNDEIRFLRDCIKRIPLQGQRLIEQHYLDGLSMEEIARRERRKAATIRQMFCRIRLQLRKCIQKKLDSEQ